MKPFIFFSFFIICLITDIAYANNLNYEINSQFRALYGYTEPDNTYEQSRNNFLLFGNINSKLSYQQNDTLSFNLHAAIKASASTYLENLNQGHWGEEVYVSMLSDYGDFYFGQMPNAASELSVTNSNLSVWQSTPANIVDFIENPNWKQNGKTKYYATLPSTAPDTDGSSLKFSYFTPEFKGTTLGLSYTPKYNANDSLISKFSSYGGKSAYSVALYNYQEFRSSDADFYISFSDYKNSHTEYGAGFSFYHKGWSLFASYLKTETQNSDKPISTQTSSKNKKAYFDDFRDSTAYNVGVSYEFAFFTSTLSYFDSYSKNTKAHNRIINLHNSIKFDKNYAIYLGFAHTDFRSYDQEDSNKGFATYAGIQFEF